MQRVTRILLQILTSVSLVAFLAVWLVPTASAHVATPNNSPYGSGYYTITHIAYTGSMNQSEYSVTISPGTSASLTQSWSVSNSFGATIQISKDIVSAQLGYNVTFTTEVSKACSSDVNTTGHDQTLEWESIYINQSYDIYWHNNLTGDDTFQGTGWATKYNGPRCALF
jgi:hypothetical protein